MNTANPHFDENGLPVSILQVEAEPLDPRENLSRAGRLIDKVPGKMVILPELYDIAYDLGGMPNLEPGMITEFKEGLASLSRSSNKTIISGCLNLDGDKPANEAVVFQDGRQTASYVKTHLCRTRPYDEREIFEPGNQLVIIKVNDWRFGLTICYDLRFAQIFQAYRRLDVDGIVLISAWPLERALHWQTLLRARAIETQSYILASDLLGKTPTVQYCGHSMAFDPWGNIIGSADAVFPASIDVILQKPILDQYRQVHPILEHQRPELYEKWRNDSPGI